jgi:hypothetical protein
MWAGDDAKARLTIGQGRQRLLQQQTMPQAAQWRHAGVCHLPTARHVTDWMGFSTRCTDLQHCGQECAPAQVCEHTGTREYANAFDERERARRKRGRRGQQRSMGSALQATGETSGTNTFVWKGFISKVSSNTPYASHHLCSFIQSFECLN